jgi:hypothetical protein
MQVITQEGVRNMATSTDDMNIENIESIEKSEKINIEKTSESEYRILKIVGLYGMVTGLVGDAIVTSHLAAAYTDAAMWIWLTSNMAWGFYGFKTKAWHLVALQASYFVFSIWGILRW